MQDFRQDQQEWFEDYKEEWWEYSQYPQYPESTPDPSNFDLDIPF